MSASRRLLGKRLRLFRIFCFAKIAMAERAGEIPNSVFETLEEWDATLQQDDIPNLLSEQKPPSPRGLRP